ncbi:VOC family protein [Streptosporangium sp. KLBMP 9127]|nr:VOC family protein [Streptosporangium sp. KLBMP 9127]
MTLDHLVYATPDLGGTVADLEGRLGVRTAVGGRHVGLGTRNHLLGLGGQGYLEIIGPDPEQEAPESPRPFGIDSLTGAGLVTWAVACPDIDAATAAARARGYDPGDPQAMSRRTPEGVLLSWRLTFARPGGRDGGLVPFLIDWGATRHPADSGLPQAELVSLSAAHPDPGSVRGDLAALGVDLDVAVGPRAGLTAVLRGRHGDVTLTGPAV